MEEQRRCGVKNEEQGRSSVEEEGRGCSVKKGWRRCSLKALEKGEDEEMGVGGRSKEKKDGGMGGGGRRRPREDRFLLFLM